jgi:hypothetical protein
MWIVNLKIYILLISNLQIFSPCLCTSSRLLFITHCYVLVDNTDDRRVLIGRLEFITPSRQPDSGKELEKCLKIVNNLISTINGDFFVAVTQFEQRIFN